MESFKEYCRIKKYVQKYEEKEKKIDKLLEEKREELFIFKISSLFFGCIVVFPIALIILMFYGVISGTGLFFACLFIFLDIFMGALWVLISYIDIFKDHYSINVKNSEYGVPNKYFQFEKMWNQYKEDKDKMEKLYDKITVKSYLEKVHDNSEELNVEEFRLLQELIEADNKERIKIENSIIANY